MKIQPLLERFAATIKGYIDKRVGDLVERVKSLDDFVKSIPTEPVIEKHIRTAVKEAIPQPIKGDPGDTPTVDELKAIIAPLIPAPMKGDNGRTPTDEELKALIAPLIPEPVKGDKGDKGDEGKSFTIEEALQLVDQAVVKVVTSLQKDWALDFERRAQELFQRAIERIPAPKDGKDGKDALEIDSFSAKLDDDGRTICLEFVAGDTKKHAHLTFPIVLDRGVYNEKGPRENALYEKGDGVTFGGSFWISQVDDPQGKPGVSKDWRLAVKKGRDGKDTVHIPRDPNEPVKLR